MHKIIVSGPESSGKTTLCKSISEYFKISFCKEYARKYLSELSKEYKQKDLLNIASNQLKSEKKESLLDTDLITIKIWSDYKYGNCDNWILEQIKLQQKENRFYLLCKPDLKWEPDPLRENPSNRMDIFKLYKKEISSLGHDYYIVEGKNRFENSIAKISKKIVLI
tara:strand:+ start:353 stop:850 length:498 start_codon:yes stop_codon:yes gene_type:complete